MERAGVAGRPLRRSPQFTFNEVARVEGRGERLGEEEMTSRFGGEILRR